MKEFEKWLCKNYGKLMDGTSFEYNTKESWKAALKWVKRELPRAEAGFINPDLGLGEILKKELEE